MKKWDKVTERIKEVYKDSKHLNIEIDKFNSQDWSKWSTLIQEAQVGGYQLNNDSTGQNKCYTALAISEPQKSSEFIISNTFYIQKSILGDFVTFYGLNRTILLYGDHKIPHPPLMILSPIGPFIDFFKDAWSLIKKEYPNVIYVPHSLLKERIEYNLDGDKKPAYNLMFGYQGKLPTNVLGDSYFEP